MPLTIDEMAAEIRAVNTEKGWRDTINSLGDYLALIHSELSEALEAYRDRRLESYTTPAGKPDDVGSEFADVLIRLIDHTEVLEVPFRVPSVAATVRWLSKAPDVRGTFGDQITRMHALTSKIFDTYERSGGKVTSTSEGFARLYRLLVQTCVANGIDLEAEYRRKIAYNRTRPFQHGGRTLADAAPGIGGTS